MSDNGQDETAYYNHEGGKRHLLVRHGTVKAVAPGLRLVKIPAREAEPHVQKSPAEGPPDYGLPV